MFRVCVEGGGVNGEGSGVMFQCSGSSFRVTVEGLGVKV